MACWNYDRTQALRDGRVQLEGVELTYLVLPPEETFFRMARFREFMVAEMSLSSYLLTLGWDDPPFIAIPVFTSRTFRHGSVYVNTREGLRQPSDLVGKRVGVPEYQMTAAVWIRGIFAEHHALPVDSVTYVTGGLEGPGRIEKLALSLPSHITVERCAPDTTLNDMLVDGEIDALYTARAPSSFLTGSSEVGRLYPDPEAVEREYFKQTGIFPIMHAIVLRRDVYQEHPWLVQELMKGFAAGRDLAYLDLRESGALHQTAPWLIRSVERTIELMGEDYWPYGLERNHAVIDRFISYSYDQGLSSRIPAAAELFAAESLESFVI